MAKKRNCRRTTDENIIHDKAVKMRKMTDEQLVHYVEDRVAKARSEGFHQGKLQAPAHKPVSIEKIVEEIGNVKGIGNIQQELFMERKEGHADEKSETGIEISGEQMEHCRAVSGTAATTPQLCRTILRQRGAAVYEAPFRH